MPEVIMDVPNLQTSAVQQMEGAWRALTANYRTLIGHSTSRPMHLCIERCSTHSKVVALRRPDHVRRT